MIFFKNIKKYNYKPKTILCLTKIIEKKSENKDADLNDIDVSQIEIIVEFGKFDFFSKNNFYLDEWDVSKVFDFSYCFRSCKKFNSDLNSWDVSNGVLFYGMFYNCYNFDKDISNFKVENGLFFNSFLLNAKKFNKSLHNFKFDVRVGSLNDFFNGCKKFNQDVSMWDVSNIHFFVQTFFKCENFKQDLSKWDVGNAQQWENVFKGSLMEKHTELMPEKFKSNCLNK